MRVAGDNGCLRKIVPNEHIIGLERWIVENNYKCYRSLKLGDINFWQTPEENKKGSSGLRGWSGCTGLPSDAPTEKELQNRLPFDDKNLVVTLSFVAPNNFYNSFVSPQFQHMLNPSGKSLAGYNITPVPTKKLYEKYNVLKKPGFDKLYSSYKELDDSITVLKLAKKSAGEYNTKFVIIEPQSDKSPDSEIIDRFEKYVGESVSNNSVITFYFLAYDIKVNVEKIKDLILMFQDKESINYDKEDRFFEEDRFFGESNNQYSKNEDENCLIM